MASSSATPAPVGCAECGRTARDMVGKAKILRCTACKAVCYCSAEHQKANWKVHKPACAGIASAKPYIVHIDFEREITDHAPWCKPLLDSISIPFSRTYALVTKPAQLMSVLDHPIPPKSILCTSADLAESAHGDLRAKLRGYIENGGRLVLGGPMPNYLTTEAMETLYTDFGAPTWKRGGYFRTTHTLNLGHPLYQALAGDSVTRAALAQSYSCKASLVDNVTQDEALYQTAEGAQHQTLVPHMQREVKTGEVAVAVKKVGKGYFAWVGDVNQEQGSNSVVLFLMGLKE